MIRFRTIEPKPAANTNKPANALRAPLAKPAPAAGKVTPRQPEASGKSGSHPSGEKLERD